MPWRLPVVWLRAGVLGLGLLLAQPCSVLADSRSGWPQAMLLMQAGQTEAALPLLERLVSQEPANKEYRFELALALFRLGHDFRAKWHLDQVRGAGLTGAEARMVEHYRDQIDARRIWSGYVGLRLRPESNAGRQTTDSTVTVGGLNFALNPAARGRPGTSTIATAGIGFHPSLAARTKGVLRLDGWLRHNRDRSLRDYHLVGRAGLEFGPDLRHRIAGGVLVGHRWVGDRAYSSSGGAWMDYSVLVGQAGRLDLGTEAARTDTTGGIPDSRRYFLSASYSHAVSGSAQISAGGFLERSESRQGNLAGDRQGLSLSGLYMFRGGLITGLRLATQTDRRDGPEPVFGLARRDRNVSLDLSLLHRDFRIGAFAPELLIGIERNHSNIPLADFENKYLSIGLSRSF